MKKKINYVKILIVVFLTCLIWITADLAKTVDWKIPSASLSVAKSTNPNLWVTFGENNEPSVTIINIVVKGPSSKIAQEERKLSEGSKTLEFYLVPEQEKGMSSPGRYNLDVVDFLKKSEAIKNLGFAVESCQPDKLTVNIRQLVKKMLPIKCYGEDGRLVTTATIEPAQIEMYVPADWQGEKCVAKVTLDRGETTQALSGITKNPYIELATNQRRSAAETVKIIIPPEEDPRKVYNITGAKLGFLLSPTLQGKYLVVPDKDNLADVIRTIPIKATLEAKQKYESMTYQIVLEIQDKDTQSTEPFIKRIVVYNLPEEYVRSGEIELQNKQPVELKFKLVPIPQPPAAGEIKIAPETTSP